MNAPLSKDATVTTGNSLPLLRFPNEVLLRIFAYVRHDLLGTNFDDESFLIDPSLSNTAESIKSLRLTCRRFCDLSTEFLLLSESI